MKRSMGLIWVGFFLALLLEMLPFPGWTLWLRPDWAFLLLITLAWLLPEKVGVGYALIIGLLLDLINGTPLGEHAIAMLPVVYLVIKFHRQLIMFPRMQQMLLVLAFVLVYKLILFVLQTMFAQEPVHILYWVAALIDMVLWPWLFMLLEDLRQRYFAD